MIGKQFIPLVKQLRSTEEPVWWRGLLFDPDVDRHMPDVSLVLFKTNRGYWLCRCNCGGRYIAVYERFNGYPIPWRQKMQWQHFIAYVVQADSRFAHLTSAYPELTFDSQGNNPVSDTVV